MRFLVVDDDTICCELLKASVSPYGVCEIAKNGSEALYHMRRALEDDQPYDAIFLDVVMPGISGLETLDGIRHIESSYNIHGPKRVKVIVITGHQNLKLSRSSFRKDCETFMEKPFHPDQVVDCLRELLGEPLPVGSSS